MRRVIAVLLFAHASLLAASEIDKASWLAGCWAGSVGERSFEERWMPARGGAMVGVARSFKGERMVNVELTTIRERDGTLVFDAYPVGQSHAAFPAVSVTGDIMTFEAPGHDFPQRIIYRRTGATTMAARIEGTTGGKPLAIDYPMNRVSCE